MVDILRGNQTIEMVDLNNNPHRHIRDFELLKQITTCELHYNKPDIIAKLEEELPKRLIGIGEYNDVLIYLYEANKFIDFIRYSASYIMEEGKVVALNLSKLEFGQSFDLDLLPDFIDLEILDLSSCDVLLPLSLSSLSSLTKLHTVIYAKRYIYKEDSQLLSSLPNLEILDLSGCNLSDISLLILLGNMNNLQTLYIEPKYVNELHFLKKMPKFKNLKVCQIETIDADIINYFGEGVICESDGYKSEVLNNFQFRQYWKDLFSGNHPDWIVSENDISNDDV
jgi:Leucine-rich repeat (LRR) protein